MENKQNDMPGAEVPTLTVQVGKCSYQVGIHFSESSKETMEEKIRRMVGQEVRERLSTS